MDKLNYDLALKLTISIAIISLIAIYMLPPGQWQTIAASICGGSLSLAASMIVQKLASNEQSQMIKAVTLDAEGVSELPDSFRKLKWIIYATTKITIESEKTIKTINWKLAKLTKVGSSGPRFAVYNFSTINLTKEPVIYTATFIGSQNTVIGVITKENEATSTITFDVNVPDAGVWFGPAYATDWAGDRLLTMAIIGTSDTVQNIEDLPDDIKASFIHWNKKVDWGATAIFEKFKMEFLKPKTLPTIGDAP